MRSQKTLGYDTEGRVSGCENLSCSEGWFTRICVKTTDGRLLTTTSASRTVFVSKDRTDEEPSYYSTGRVPVARVAILLAENLKRLYMGGGIL